METLILRHIDFNKCYSYLLLGGFLWVVSVAMVPVKAIPQKPVQTALHFIEFCLTLYIYLGFIKYSLIEKKDVFRKLIFAAIALSTIQSSIAITATLINKGDFNFNAVPFALECILLSFAFKSLQDIKISYFKTISRLS